MNVIYTDPFKSDYEDLSLDRQRALERALKFLMENPRHPSLRIKKLPGTDIWYGRFGRADRFTFQLNDHIIVLRRAGTHKILDRERR